MAAAGGMASGAIPSVTGDGCELARNLAAQLPGLGRRVGRLATIGAIVGGALGHFGADALGLGCNVRPAHDVPALVAADLGCIDALRARFPSLSLEAAAGLCVVDDGDAMTANVTLTEVDRANRAVSQAVELVQALEARGADGGRD